MGQFTGFPLSTRGAFKAPSTALPPVFLLLLLACRIHQCSQMVHAARPQNGAKTTPEPTAPLSPSFNPLTGEGYGTSSGGDVLDTVRQSGEHSAEPTRTRRVISSTLKYKEKRHSTNKQSSVKHTHSHPGVRMSPEVKQSISKPMSVPTSRPPPPQHPSTSTPPSFFHPPVPSVSSPPRRKPALPPSPPPAVPDSSSLSRVRKRHPAKPSFPPPPPPTFFSAVLPPDSPRPSSSRPSFPPPPPPPPPPPLPFASLTQKATVPSPAFSSPPSSRAGSPFSPSTPSFSSATASSSPSAASSSGTSSSSDPSPAPPPIPPPFPIPSFPSTTFSYIPAPPAAASGATSVQIRPRFLPSSSSSSFSSSSSRGVMPSSVGASSSASSSSSHPLCSSSRHTSTSSSSSYKPTMPSPGTSPPPPPFPSPCIVPVSVITAKLTSTLTRLSTASHATSSSSSAAPRSRGRSSSPTTASSSKQISGHPPPQAQEKTSIRRRLSLFFSRGPHLEKDSAGPYAITTINTTESEGENTTENGEGTGKMNTWRRLKKLVGGRGAGRQRGISQEAKAPTKGTGFPQLYQHPPSIIIPQPESPAHATQEASSASNMWQAASLQRTSDTLEDAEAEAVRTGAKPKKPTGSKGGQQSRKSKATEASSDGGPRRGPINPSKLPHVGIMDETSHGEGEASGVKASPQGNAPLPTVVYDIPPDAQRTPSSDSVYDTLPSTRGLPGPGARSRTPSGKGEPGPGQDGRVPGLMYHLSPDAEDASGYSQYDPFLEEDSFEDVSDDPSDVFEDQSTSVEQTQPGDSHYENVASGSPKFYLPQSPRDQESRRSAFTAVSSSDSPLTLYEEVEYGRDATPQQPAGQEKKKRGGKTYFGKKRSQQSTSSSDHGGPETGSLRVFRRYRNYVTRIAQSHRRSTASSSSVHAHDSAPTGDPIYDTID